MRGILDSAMDAIITVDDAQHVVLFNAAAEAMFGCPRREALGAPLAWFIPERFRGAARRARAALRRDRHRVAPDGRAAHRHGLAPQRRGVPDRRVDLAARRIRRQVLHGDPARRLRARPRRGGAAAVQGRAARARRRGAATPASRKRAASRASFTTSSAQALTALQMDVAWCKEKIPEGQTTTVARLDQDGSAAGRDGRGDAADRGRPASADARRPGSRARGRVAVQRPSPSAPASRASWSMDGAELDLPSAQATAVFRIVQESLTNVGKHARASRAKVAHRAQRLGSGAQHPRRRRRLLAARLRASRTRTGCSACASARRSCGGEVTDHQRAGRGHARSKCRLPLAPPTLAS